jgi:hypothetical protein
MFSFSRKGKHVFYHVVRMELEHLGSVSHKIDRDECEKIPDKDKKCKERAILTSIQ